jgi:hypothetical protein
VIAQNKKEKRKENVSMNNFHVAYTKHWRIRRGRPTDGWRLETLREKQEVQLWKLTVRQSAQKVKEKNFVRRN